MKFFVDTSDVAEIRKLNAFGFVDGVTTNPSLIMKSNRPMREVIGEICEIVSGPVSAETTALDAENMVLEGRTLAAIAGNVVIKVPVTMDGLKACRALTDEGMKVNVTLCFSALQALLASRAGAEFISPFIGRVDDAHYDGLSVISDIRTIYDNYGFDTQILAASVRNVGHIRECALIGADVVTAPPAVLSSLAAHPLTDIGLAKFLADWEKTGQSILP